MAAADDGYATPAAAIISLAIALVVTGVMARSVSELQLAKAALAKTQAEYAASAAVQLALISIATTSQPPPYRWTATSLGRNYRMLAEPERAKISPAAMADLDDASFTALGVSAPDVLRARLRSLTLAPKLAWIADQADAPLWRACAPSFTSVYGAASSLQPPVYKDPQAGSALPSFRAGEVWRVEVIDPDGWRDERVVQLTGDSFTPAAVIDRRFTRTSEGLPTCEDLLGAPSAG